MSLTRKPLGSHHRIVIKIGSALLVDRKSGLKKDWLDAICEDIAAEDVIYPIVVPPGCFLHGVYWKVEAAETGVTLAMSSVRGAFNAAIDGAVLGDHVPGHVRASGTQHGVQRCGGGLAVPGPRVVPVDASLDHRQSGLVIGTVEVVQTKVTGTRGAHQV